MFAPTSRGTRIAFSRDCRSAFHCAPDLALKRGNSRSLFRGISVTECVRLGPNGSRFTVSKGPLSARKIIRATRPRATAASPRGGCRNETNVLHLKFFREPPSFALTSRVLGRSPVSTRGDNAFLVVPGSVRPRDTQVAGTRSEAWPLVTRHRESHMCRLCIAAR